MIKFARDFRLIPVVLLATVSLFALKVSGLVLDGGYTLAERLQGRDKNSLTITSPDSVPDFPKIVVADGPPPEPVTRKQSWAQEMFNYADRNRNDVTGSVGGGGNAPKAPEQPPLKSSEKAPAPAKLQVAGNAYPLEPGKLTSPGERAVLERLQERRKELDTRNHDIEMRESLLKAAEKRVEEKVAELKAVETRISATVTTRDQQEQHRFKSIVTMYEAMKAKDAARIFDRLDLKVLVEVSMAMNPRKMSEILAQMTPEAAEKLTVELARRATSQPQQPAAGDELPKIEGRPQG